MKIFLILFLGSAIVLWISTFGYMLVLSLMALRRRHSTPEIKDWPPIAIVVPVLNEESLILAKLQDLNLCDYPADRRTIVVLDGGSRDQTAVLVEREIGRGVRVQLKCIDGSAGKAEQINYALRKLSPDIIVITDVDSRLDPSCIKQLVQVLIQDPKTAVVGASVSPASVLLEERIHWQLLNFLWWLEGEAFDSSGVSGVCYAIRRNAVIPISRSARADDISLVVSASSGGFGSRLSRQARATEIRVPQTAAELLRYRRRRGKSYRAALLSSPRESLLGAGARFARRIRLWHFKGAPQLAALLFAAGCVLTGTSYRPYALAALLAFVIPIIAVILISASHVRESGSWWKLVLASARFLALTLVSLLTLNKYKLKTVSTRSQS